MSTQMTKEFDVVTVGRAVVDLYPGEDARAPKSVESYRQYLGGSPTNVAVAAARAGLRAAVVTRTGDDLFHDFVVDQLERFGVDTRWVRSVSGSRTTLAVCDLEEPSVPGLDFFRHAQPPEDALEGEGLIAAASVARVLWLTASGFATPRSARAHDAVLGVPERLVLDLDYRRDFWRDKRDLHERLRSVLPHVDTVIGNVEEAEIALGVPGSPRELALGLLRTGPRLAIVKLGAEGALAATVDGVTEQAAYPAEVVNGLGAGDAFGGYIVKGMIAGWSLADMLRHAAAAGSIVASRRGCSVAMPTAAEVAELVADADRQGCGQGGDVHCS
ncbi:5-dehydro-2-deoxygluconokinase [Ruania alkalisoli]|uniref:5-dehydro-2-deoxygluconokinase n=1 Tax=Ruania alkalisoli TaxID=2779775 RepID=A0A7M1SRG7_9MICO|nr:PfkB family carbohydrate kinase [Ruania alkalisoli]QOR70075.1 5-dehydro-2-deoxygluconokinase [Ruania alkalisoli]